jgi:hypothetical protein
MVEPYICIHELVVRAQQLASVAQYCTGIAEPQV